MKTIATDLINLIQNGVKPEAIDAVITIENGEVTACGIFVDFKENKPEPEKPTGQTNKTKGVIMIKIPCLQDCANVISNTLNIGIGKAKNYAIERIVPKHVFTGSEEEIQKAMSSLANRLSAIGVEYQVCY